MRLPLSPVEIRRCRPLLGTFVEITASGLETAPLNAAIDAAFAAIGKIQAQMNAHDPESELFRLNQEAHLCPVAVSRDLFTMLRRADRLASQSQGAFDYTIGPTLARWGYLPGKLKRAHSGNWRQVMLLRGRKIFFQTPLALDLGGIAKGFAVDRAVHILRQHGVSTATVNAGGDLRVFGPAPSVVHLRHPSRPWMLSNHLNLHDSALATSSPCFSQRIRQGRRVSHLVNPTGQHAVTGSISVSVKAPECWLADGLTKVVLNAPGIAQKLLAKYQAEAFIVTA